MKSVHETMADYTITLRTALNQGNANRALRAVLKFAGHRGLKCTSIVHTNPQPLEKTSERLAADDSTVTPSTGQATA